MAADTTAMADLRSYLRNGCVVVGVGNVLRSDDGLGSVLVQRLAARATGSRMGVELVDAGGGLENHMGRILRRKPRSVLLVDAAQIGGRPGDWVLLCPEELDAGASGTHDLSLGMLADHLRRELPGTDVRVLAVQPQSTAVGEALSPVVARTLAWIERQMEEAL